MRLYKIEDYFLIAALLFLIAWMAKAVINMPIVEWSHTEQRCVNVYNVDGYTCDNLPLKYEVVMVR